MELLREYQKEHPEECVEINKLKMVSMQIDLMRKERVQAKLKKIEECRRKLYGKE